MSCSALFAIKRAIENFRAEIKAQTVFTLGKVQSWNLNDIIILSTLTRAIIITIIIIRHSFSITFLSVYIDGPATVEATQLDCLVDPSEFISEQLTVTKPLVGL